MRETRRLAAVLFSDIKGYSSQMDRDEEGALARLDVHNAIFREQIAAHEGREVKTIGDAFMVEYPSAVHAISCGLEVQRALAAHNASAEEPIEVRMGVHVGDVIDREGDLFGETVNVAARLEPQAPPGEICISQAVLDQVAKKVDAAATNLGKRTLKNMPTMSLWALKPDDSRLQLPGAIPPKMEKAATKRWVPLALIGALVLVAISVAKWWPAAEPKSPSKNTLGVETGTSVENSTSVNGPKAKVLKIGIGGEWGERFDVFSSVNTLSARVQDMVLERLVWANPDGSYAPAAIASWKIAKDGALVILHPEPEAHFHPHRCLPESRRVHPDDVVWSLELAAKHRGLDLGTATVVDGTVEIRRSAPTPWPLHPLDEVLLLPKELEGCADPRNLDQLVGTGPYQMTAPLSGDVLKLVQADVRGGAVQTLEIRPIQQQAERALVHIAEGSLDMALLWLPEESTQTKVRNHLPADVQLTGAKPSGWLQLLSISMLSQDKPSLWDSPLVRRALAVGVERKVLAPLHPGKVEPAGRVLHSRWLGYDPLTPPLGHDPSAAREALAEAGYPKGHNLPPLVLGTKPERMELAEEMREQLAKIGIKVDIRKLNQATMQQAFESSTLDAILVQFNYGALGTDPYPAIVQKPGEGILPSLADVIALRDRAAVTSKRGERGRLYAEIERSVLKALDLIPLGMTLDDTPTEFWLHHEGVTFPFVDTITGVTGGQSPASWWRTVSARAR